MTPKLQTYYLSYLDGLEPLPPLQRDRKKPKYFDKKFQLAVLGLLGALAAAQQHAFHSNTKKKKDFNNHCTAPKVTKKN